MQRTPTAYATVIKDVLTRPSALFSCVCFKKGTPRTADGIACESYFYCALGVLKTSGLVCHHSPQ